MIIKIGDLLGKVSLKLTNTLLNIYKTEYKLNLD